MEQRPTALRSPFNDELWPVPNDLPADTLEAMIRAGFKPEEPIAATVPQKRGPGRPRKQETTE